MLSLLLLGPNAAAFYLTGISERVEQLESGDCTISEPSASKSSHVYRDDVVAGAPPVLKLTGPFISNSMSNGWLAGSGRSNVM